ncbi:MAG: hypothetical protein WCI41_01155 [bacterium]
MKTLKVIHPDYDPIETGIIILAQHRNRQEILSDISKYKLDLKFRENILNCCKNNKTKTEVLRIDELTKNKKDKEVKKELSIKEINPDQIVERIIQARENKQWTIVGYCNDLVVCIYPPLENGLIEIFTCELDARPATRYVFSNVELEDFIPDLLNKNNIHVKQDDNNHIWL